MGWLSSHNYYNFDLTINEYNYLNNIMLHFYNEAETKRQEKEEIKLLNKISPGARNAGKFNM
jgi:hypothetical protein